jgi:hypothetical protein
MLNVEAIFRLDNIFFNFFQTLFSKNMQKNKSFNVSLRCKNLWNTVQKKKRHIKFERHSEFLRKIMSIKVK